MSVLAGGEYGEVEMGLSETKRIGSKGDNSGAWDRMEGEEGRGTSLGELREACLLDNDD